MTKQKKMIVANWKMNPVTPREAKALYLQTKKISSKNPQAEIIVCPPAIWLGFLNHRPSKNLSLGAQDFSVDKSVGAFTGSVSSAMAHYAGATYSIVGHSERRSAGDDFEKVNLKVRLALGDGLKVILCIGERVRDNGGQYLAVIKRQLESGLDGVKRNQFANIAIAYEPVWAIGKEATGADTPEDFLHDALFIRKVISEIVGKSYAHEVKIFYGGSVNPKNARGFLEEGQADGLLVGRASLNAEQFKQIVETTKPIKK
jgi:triosephosphate isomerase (TIM)